MKLVETYTFTFFHNYFGEEVTEPVDAPNDLAYFCLVDMFTPCTKKEIKEHIFKDCCLLASGAGLLDQGRRCRYEGVDWWMLTVGCFLVLEMKVHALPVDSDSAGLQYSLRKPFPSERSYVRV